LGKRIFVALILLIISLTLINLSALSEKRLSLGGGVVGSSPKVVGSYRWNSLGLTAGLGFNGSKTALSTGARYYFSFFENLAAEPYLGAGLLFTTKENTGPSPPPAPPNPNLSRSSNTDGGGGNSIAAALTGGLEISFSRSNLPVSLWAGIVYIPGSSTTTQNSARNGVSIGAKLWL